MPLANSAQTYGSVTRTLHWLTALLIAIIIPVGLVANDMAQALLDPAIASTTDDFTTTFALFSLHKTLGVAIFLVALTRIFWALTQPKPAPLNGAGAIESLLAGTVHWVLYTALVLVPLAGWISHAATSGYAPIRWPFGQDLPLVPKDPRLAATFAGLHLVLLRVLVIALALHVAAALKHHFRDRDATLRRMLWGARPATTATRPGRLLPPLAALAIWGIAIAGGLALGAIPPLADPPPAAAMSEPDRPPGTAANWRVEKGSLTLTITRFATPLQGSFDDWRANIAFDETIASGPLGRVDVEISVPSLSLGNVTQQAMGPDFFDADFFSRASFSGEITRTDTGYVATGPLVIRDTSLPVTLPFNLTLTGDEARMTAGLTLNRMDFGVGATMPDDSALGFDVTVTISLTATRDR